MQFRLALGGCIAIASAMGIGRFVYTPILPAMAETLAMTRAEAGFIASANFLGYLAGALATMRRPAGLRPRTLLLAALAGSAVTTGAMALAPDVASAAFLRFVGGAVSAVAFVMASLAVLDGLAAAGRGDLAAIHFAGVGIGIALSSLTVSLLAAAGFGEAAQWTICGLVSLACVPAVARLIPPGVDPGVQPSRGAPRPVRDGRLTAQITAYGLFGFGYVITATFIVAIVRETPEARAVEPFVWLTVGLAAAPSVALWNAIGKRIGNDRAYALAALIEAIGVCASVLAPGPAGALVAAFFLGATFMGLTSLGLIGARNLARGDTQRVLAAMTVAFGLGQMVGPIIGGFVSDATGDYRLASLIAATALLAAGGFALVAGRRAP